MDYTIYIDAAPAFLQTDSAPVAVEVGNAPGPPGITTAESVLDLIAPNPLWLDETFNYLGASGISPSYAPTLDLFIRNLKTIGAWDDLSMWILDNRYQGAGTAVIGTGGVPIDGIKDNGLGIITESGEEYYFSRGTARIWTPVALMPTIPEMSLMMVGKLPIQNSNYGGMFGGRTGFASINSQSSYTSLALGDGAITGRVASHVFSNAAQSPYDPPLLTPTPRACYLLSVTGETTGNCSVNGGSLVASSIPSVGTGNAAATNYSTIAKDNQASIWGPGDNSIQSSAPGAASFVAFWRTNQSSKAAQIYNLYKATIGSHLELP